MSIRPESTARTLRVWSDYAQFDKDGMSNVECFRASGMDICGHHYERIYIVPRAQLAKFPDLRASAVTEVLRRINGAMDECEKNNGR